MILAPAPIRRPRRGPRYRRCRRCGGLVIPHRRNRYGATRPVLVDALGVQITPGVGVNLFPGDGPVIADAYAACCCAEGPNCCSGFCGPCGAFDPASLTWSMSWSIDPGTLADGEPCLSNAVLASHSVGPFVPTTNGDWSCVELVDDGEIPAGGGYDCPPTVGFTFDVGCNSFVDPATANWEGTITYGIYAFRGAVVGPCPEPGASATATIDFPTEASGTITMTLGGTNPCAPELP